MVCSGVVQPCFDQLPNLLPENSDKSDISIGDNHAWQTPVRKRQEINGVPTRFCMMMEYNEVFYSIDGVGKSYGQDTPLLTTTYPHYQMPIHINPLPPAHHPHHVTTHPEHRQQPSARLVSDHPRQPASNAGPELSQGAMGR